MAVISFTECDAEIDDWSDRELIPRLALVVSLVEAHEEEEIPDDRGVLSMLALILFAVVEEDVDESAAAAVEDMEVLTTLEETAVAEKALTILLCHLVSPLLHVLRPMTLPEPVLVSILCRTSRLFLHHIP